MLEVRMVSPRGTDSSRGWNEGISAPATLMRLAAGAGRKAQERTSIVQALSYTGIVDLRPPRAE